MEDGDTDGDNHSDRDSDKFGNGIVYAMRKGEGRKDLRPLTYAHVGRTKKARFLHRKRASF